jgi:hypothetical protein
MGRFPASLAIAFAMVTSALPAAAQIVVKPLTPAQLAPPAILVNRIDANCAVFRNAIRTEQPVEVAAVGSTAFVRLDAAHRAQVEAMTDHVWVVQAWKQAGNLNWVRSARFDAQGAAHLTQLCFRNDGTLARVRQAATLSDLDVAAIGEAYYRTDGSLIRSTQLFQRDDPAIPQRSASPPYRPLAP